MSDYEDEEPNFRIIDEDEEVEEAKQARKPSKNDKAGKTKEEPLEQPQEEDKKQNEEEEYREEELEEEEIEPDLISHSAYSDYEEEEQEEKKEKEEEQEAPRRIEPPKNESEEIVTVQSGRQQQVQQQQQKPPERKVEIKQKKVKSKHKRKRKDKAKKETKEKKEKIPLGEKTLRLALKWTRTPARIIARKIPSIQQNLLKSNMSISAEGLVAICLFIGILLIPVAFLGAAFLVEAGFWFVAPALAAVIPAPLLFGIMLPKISAGSRGQAIDNELPYLIGYITTLAGGGISPFVTLKRIAKADKIFPASAREARRILLDIEVLGLDPISALERATRYNPNKAFADFIGGYVAVLKTGGNAVSYLESKLKDTFNYREVKVRSTANFMESMAEAYIIMTVVMGIAFTVLFATQNLMGGGNGGVGTANPTQSIDPTQIELFSGVFVPFISLVFIMIFNSVQLKVPMSYNLPYYVFFACMPSAFIFFFSPLSLAPYYKLAIGLALTTGPASIVNQIYKNRKKSVESKLANFLRDISEVRKTGLAPEKTIEQLADRNYGGLSKHVQKISVQLSWGTPIRVVLQDFSNSVRSWLTQAMTFLLLEVVDVGGGSPKMFINLADFTEKNAQLEKERRSMIRPYIIIPYIGAIMVVITTAMMVYFISAPQLGSSFSQYIATPQVITDATNILLTASFFQAWVMGLVAGKMGEDTVADGFKHSTFLILISLGVALVSQSLVTLLAV